MNLIIPENYDPVLSLRQTQEAIKYISSYSNCAAVNIVAR